MDHAKDRVQLIANLKVLLALIGLFILLFGGLFQ